MFLEYVDVAYLRCLLNHVLSSLRKIREDGFKDHRIDILCHQIQTKIEYLDEMLLPMQDSYFIDSSNMANGAWKKLMEEAGEFKQEVEKGDRDKMESEMGDLLFSIINVARLYKINPENALEKTNKKFIARFNYVERKAHEIGRHLNEMTLAEMDELWDEAKSIGL